MKMKPIYGYNVLKECVSTITQKVYTRREDTYYIKTTKEKSIRYTREYTK